MAPLTSFDSFNDVSPFSQVFPQIGASRRPAAAAPDRNFELPDGRLGIRDEEKRRSNRSTEDQRAASDEGPLNFDSDRFRR